MSGAGGIVWLASFPKSGNTWFRIFLANLAAGEKGPADINKLENPGGIASSRHEFESMTLLDSGLARHDDVDALRHQVYARIAAESSEPRWIKAHDAYTRTVSGEPMFGVSGARAVYLVRDPRDVAVSLSHHNNCSIDVAIALMNDPTGAYCAGRKGQPSQLRQQLLGWSGHAASWMDQPDVPTLVLRYEDLRADPVANFTTALAFAGETATKDEIARALHHADFKELQRQEQEKGFGERRSRSVPFFRSGRSGGWRDVLNRAQLDRIQVAHEAMMRRLDYKCE